VRTLNDEKRYASFAVDGLQVTAISCHKVVQLPKVYTQEQLPIDPGEIPSHSLLHRWSHLKGLAAEMPERDTNIPIGLLIGANYVKALEPHRVIPSVNGGPYAVKTALGWCISGPTETGDNVELTGRVTCHHIVAVEDTKVRDMFIEMYNNDFNESFSHPVYGPDSTSTSLSCVGDMLKK
jgi:hypothetical protein